MNNHSRSVVRLVSSVAQIAALLATAAFAHAQSVNDFYNVVMQDGADPSIVRHTDGWYYRTKSTGGNVTLWRTKTLSGIGSGQSRTIWTPPSGTAYSQNLWAPEIFFYNNKWYVYVAADNGTNANHRMYVLESAGPDPFVGAWTFRGQMTDPTNLWAIDGTVFEVNGQLYTIWSGWPTLTNSQQNLYIATMSNPWTINSNRVQISTPSHSWETSTQAIQEGPEVLIRNGKINVIYSASASWTNSYCLGLLTANVGSNLLSASSWTKKSTPVFSSGNGIYGPGHNTFTKSPNGAEDWIVYHCARWSGSGWTRQVRAQKFTWNSDNTPNFGTPVSHDARIALPAGETARWRYEAENAALSGSPTISSHSTASNGQYVTLDATGEAVQFTVNVPVAGEYVLAVRAATTTTTADSSFSVSMNGGTASTLTVARGGGQNWTAPAVRRTLLAGSNTIRFTKNVNNTQLDAIDLFPSNYSPVFMLVNKNSGKSADLINGSTANGSVINQWSYDYPNIDQHWTLAPTEDGNHFKIVCQRAGFTPGKVLCVQANSTANGAQIHLWDYSGNPGQQWDLIYVGEGWYKIQNVNSGKVLEVANASTADGAKLQQGTDTGSAAQLFRLHPVGDYFIRTLADKFVTMSGTAGANGAAIIQSSWQNISAFKWHFYPNSEGWERVSSNVNSNRAVSIDGSSVTAGANAIYYDYASTNQSQKIRLFPMTNGKFKFYFKHSDMVWDVYGGSSANNTPIKQYPGNSYIRQQFELERSY